MEKLTIYLKSGQTINVKCDDWKFNYNAQQDEYTAYEFKGLKSPSRVGICPGQIAAYIVE